MTVTMADMLIHMKLDSGIDEFLAKHENEPDEKLIFIADYERDTTRRYTLKQLRDGAQELKERNINNEES